MKDKLKTIKIALRDFSLPTPRTGSLEANSGYGNTNLEGIELHQWLQKKNSSDKKYRSEVRMKHEFEKAPYRFVVEGRMDGLYDHEVPHIEEIKSTFNIHDLARSLESKGMRHPYYLQVLSYGYLFWKTHEVRPKLTLLLISTRNKETLSFPVELDVPEYEKWLELRLAEMVQEAQQSEKRTLRRKKIAASLPFPFEKPRLGQMELIKTIEEGFQEKKRMLIQAPTGLGKTVGVLYPALKEAFGRGQKVIYTTPKNSQHLVAEEGVEKFEDQGVKLKSLTITSKAKMCLKAEVLCNPEYCEFAKNYYDKLAQHDLRTILTKKKNLNAKLFKKMGAEYEVCPFELQLEGMTEADTVICDYNYVFANRSILGRVPLSGFAQEGDPNLVIDEAHNLPSRAMDYYSPSLSGSILEEMRPGIEALPKSFMKEGLRLLADCQEVITDSRLPGKASGVIDLIPETFLDLEERLKSYLSDYLSSSAEIKPRDPVLALNFYWSEFTAILCEIKENKRPEFFITYQEGAHGGSVKIVCCDASQMLKARYDDYENVVSFSATLKPFKFYAQLSGLEWETIKTAEFTSPFKKENRKILIIPQVSTKYSDRHRSYGRVAEVISRVSSSRRGNYLVFFGSFDFMEKTLAEFKLPAGYKMLKQKRGMKNPETEDYLSQLKSETTPIILFAVQGGIFSEGVDYPEGMAIGTFVVGPALPHFNFEREMMRKFYEDHYQDGFNYAYTYSAMAKAIQSAGRVIRTETDKGIIVLLDDRFLLNDYTQTMPQDWFESRPHELVSTNILDDIQDFWKEV